MTAIYGQCSECKRFIIWHPEQNAFVADEQWHYVNGAKVCHECFAKLIAKYGTVGERSASEKGKP